MGQLIKEITRDVIILTISIFLVGISAGFSASAAVKITKIHNWDDDDNLVDAHGKLSWAATVGWIYIGLLILLVIILIIIALTGFIDFGISDIIEASVVPIILVIVNIFNIGILITIGILAAQGASAIQKSNVDNDQGSFSDALIATFTSIGSIAVVLIYIAGKWIYKEYEKKAKEKSTAAKVESEAKFALELAKSKSNTPSSPQPSQ